MIEHTSLLTSELIVRVCLFIAATIGLAGGALQLYLGQPTTSPRLDNVHRFMAGIHFSTGFINFWAGITIQQQGTLIYLLAFGILCGGVGRLVSIKKVGLPKPTILWIGYLIPELCLPFIIAVAHSMTKTI